jgi:hypothetical protein
MEMLRILSNYNFYPYSYSSNNPHDPRVHNKSGIVITIHKPYEQGNENFNFDILNAYACPNILQYISSKQNEKEPGTAFLVATVDEKNLEKLIEDIRNFWHFEAQ